MLNCFSKLQSLRVNPVLLYNNNIFLCRISVFLFLLLLDILASDVQCMQVIPYIEPEHKTLNTFEWVAIIPKPG